MDTQSDTNHSAGESGSALAARVPQPAPVVTTPGDTSRRVKAAMALQTLSREDPVQRANNCTTVNRFDLEPTNLVW